MRLIDSLRTSPQAAGSRSRLPLRLFSAITASSVPSPWRAHLCVEQCLNLTALDPIGQVAGHVGAQRVATDQQAQFGGVARQEERRLSGRVAAADDDQGIARTGPRLRQRRGVVHTVALELLEARDRQFAVAGAAGDQNGPREYLAIAGEPHEVAVFTASGTNASAGTTIRTPNVLA
jgi:hypothetical protein